MISNGKSVTVKNLTVFRAGRCLCFVENDNIDENGDIIDTNETLNITIKEWKEMMGLMAQLEEDDVKTK